MRYQILVYQWQLTVCYRHLPVTQWPAQLDLGYFSVPVDAEARLRVTGKIYSYSGTGQDGRLLVTALI